MKFLRVAPSLIGDLLALRAGAASSKVWRACVMQRFGPSTGIFFGGHMAEGNVTEAKVARITGIAFALLWVVMLGLKMISGL
jgi:hypothetical protein